MSAADDVLEQITPHLANIQASNDTTGLSGRGPEWVMPASHLFIKFMIGQQLPFPTQPTTGAIFFETIGEPWPAIHSRNPTGLGGGSVQPVLPAEAAIFQFFFGVQPLIHRTSGDMIFADGARFKYAQFARPPGRQRAGQPAAGPVLSPPALRGRSRERPRPPARPRPRTRLGEVLTPGRKLPTRADRQAVPAAAPRRPTLRLKRRRAQARSGDGDAASVGASPLWRGQALAAAATAAAAALAAAAGYCPAPAFLPFSFVVSSREKPPALFACVPGVQRPKGRVAAHLRDTANKRRSIPTLLLPLFFVLHAHMLSVRRRVFQGACFPIPGVPDFCRRK